MPSLASTTVVTPDAFSLAMICDAWAWIVPGSRVYGKVSATVAPSSIMPRTSASAIDWERSVDEM